jgi:hypothetical protein
MSVVTLLVLMVSPEEIMISFRENLRNYKVRTKGSETILKRFNNTRVLTKVTLRLSLRRWSP